ncbi:MULTISPECIES: transglycosylase SLT domain-containing protein [Nonomuraea]|uniref:WXG100 family type VII secretion target n=1 Tax=Nonomuraea mangrovi TaxID=2316207 RepID=A0ABW4SQ60_9ACTN
MTENATPGVDRLDALVAKVTCDPAAIRTMAKQWRAIAGEVLDETGKLGKAVIEVGRTWHGDSANDFQSYMQGYGKAGDGLHDALAGCANAADTLAKDLETAEGKVRWIREDLITRANQYRIDWNKLNPDDPDGVDKGLKEMGDKAVSDAESWAGKANTALSDAKTAIADALKLRTVTFKSINDPLLRDFVPDDDRTKMQWLPTDLSRTTDLAGTNPSGAGGAGAGGGGGGYGGGGVSSAGDVPAPRAQVVEWIKEALRIIRSPEMAGIMRSRGIDVSDLDPDDPKDIERIWTIIHHESGGNPSAINNWDINARNGVPSQGLMQTIPPTFNTHSLPGHKQILEPVDNIIAGVLYTYKRYGDLGHHPGIASLERGGGYRPY